MKSTLKFLSMVLGTALAGIVVGGVAGLIIGYAMRDSLFGFGAFAGGLMGLLGGYPVGIVVGVILFRKVFKYAGSIILGIFGALLGGVIPLGLSEVVHVLTAQWTMIVFVVLAPLLATVGFYIGKKQPATKKKQRKR